MLRENAMAKEKIVGGELSHEMNRLLAEWRDREASEQAKELPQLVKNLSQLAEGYPIQATCLAAHDTAEVD
ncbi:MAG: hypothetical protein ACM359_23465 [Bacillota bacterium]